MKQENDVRLIDLRFVKDTLSELDASLDGSEQNEFYRTGLVAVSALVCGPHTERLAKFTELSPDFVETIRQRMIRADFGPTSTFSTTTGLVKETWFHNGGLARCANCPGPSGATMG